MLKGIKPRRAGVQKNGAFQEGMHRGDLSFIHKDRAQSFKGSNNSRMPAFHKPVWQQGK
jgi:hypothetical protein